MNTTTINCKMRNKKPIKIEFTQIPLEVERAFAKKAMIKEYCKGNIPFEQLTENGIKFATPISINNRQ